MGGDQHKEHKMSADVIKAIGVYCVNNGHGVSQIGRLIGAGLNLCCITMVLSTFVQSSNGKSRRFRLSTGFSLCRRYRGHCRVLGS